MKSWEELEKDLQKSKEAFWGHEAVWRMGHKIGVGEGVGALIKILMTSKLLDFDKGRDIWRKVNKAVKHSSLEELSSPYQTIKRALE